MNEMREAISKRLRAEGGSRIADLYEGAVRLIEDRKFPGRFRLICHAVREMRNRMPLLFGVPESPRIEYKKELIEIEAELSKHISVTEGYESGTEEVESHVYLSQNVYRKIVDLVKRSKAIAITYRQRVEEMLVVLDAGNESDRAGLRTVVADWFKSSSWFVEGAHLPGSTEADRELRLGSTELEGRFETFEKGLGSILDRFLAGQERIEKFIERHRRGEPREEGVSELTSLLFGRAQFRWYFFQHFDNAEWIESLCERGWFKDPPKVKEDGGGALSFPWWPQGTYLKRIAAEKPREVLAIVCAVRSDNPQVLKACIEALLEMEAEVAAGGVDFVIGALRASGAYGQVEWHWIGEEAAALMVKLAEKYPNEAFAIAGELLKIWWSNGEQRGIAAGEVCARMSEYWYRDFVTKTYSDLWKRYPWRACRMLIDVLDSYCKQAADDHWVESGFVHKVEEVGKADADAVYANDIIVTIVWGTAEAGRAVLKQERENVTAMLDYLEERNSPIFWRISMELLRIAGEGIEADRVNRIIGDRRFLEEPYYEREYKLLLNEREEVSAEARKVFEQWVDGLQIDKEERKQWHGTEVSAEEETRANARIRAQELYLVKERYEEKFKRYREMAGMTKVEEAAPRAWISDMHCLDPTEGAEYSQEEWMTADPAEVIALCIRRAEDWKQPDKDAWNWARLGIDAQAEVLRHVVQKRVSDYLAVECEQVVRLPPSFLERFMIGMWEALEAVKKEVDWERMLCLAEAIVRRHGDVKEYATALKYVCSVLRVAFDDEELREKVVRKNVARAWEIIWGCVQYRHEEGHVSIDRQRDFVTDCINTIVGKAFQLAIRLGVICKNKDREEKASEYEDSLSEKLKECLNLMLASERLEVLCVFGMWFPQLCYVEKEWVRANLDRMFTDENNARWDAVWGTYVGWGRISRESFEVLVAGGKYSVAIEKIGEFQGTRGGRRTLDEGLAQHLMIAYFNGWIEYEDALLRQFFKKASAELRGYAAWFLTTGFKAIKESEQKDEGKNEAIAVRMRRYWNERLAIAEGSPKDNVDEVKGFATWIKDTLLPEGETLELLGKTLQLTDGEVRKHGQGLHAVLEGLFELGEDHELEVLKCLNLLRQDKEFWMVHHIVKEQLGKFLRHVVELEGGGVDVREAQEQAIEFVDELGSMGIMDYRDLYVALREKVG